MEISTFPRYVNLRKYLTLMKLKSTANPVYAFLLRIIVYKQFIHVSLITDMAVFYQIADHIFIQNTPMLVSSISTPLGTGLGSEPISQL